MNAFAVWLSTTAPSVFIQNHEAWMIPCIQSLHIIGIGVLVGSVLMLVLRVLGWAGTDQTLAQSRRRYGPPLTGALYLLLGSGGLLIVAEPVRELVTISFWLKMLLVATVAVLAALFQSSVRRQEERWEQSLASRRGVQLTAVFILVMLGCIILLGRLIAYDHIWGHWSPATKA